MLYLSRSRDEHVSSFSLKSLSTCSESIQSRFSQVVVDAVIKTGHPSGLWSSFRANRES